MSPYAGFKETSYFHKFLHNKHVHRNEIADIERVQCNPQNVLCFCCSFIFLKLLLNCLQQDISCCLSQRRSSSTTTTPTHHPPLCHPSTPNMQISLGCRTICWLWCGCPVGPGKRAKTQSLSVRGAWSVHAHVSICFNLQTWAKSLPVSVPISQCHAALCLGSDHEWCHRSRRYCRGLSDGNIPCPNCRLHEYTPACSNVCAWIWHTVGTKRHCKFTATTFTVNTSQKRRQKSDSRTPTSTWSVMWASGFWIDMLFALLLSATPLVQHHQLAENSKLRTTDNK